MTFRAGLTAIGLATLAVWGAACDRTYLTPSHGRSYREAFAAQTVNPEGRSNKKVVLGLDSQEASIIAATYRRSLAPAQSQEANQTQLLTYSPRVAAMREASAVPASSVPQGQ